MTAGPDAAPRSRKSSINTAAAPRTSGAAAATTTAAAGSGGDAQPYGRATLTDVEEDQRLELFEPSFGTFHTDIGPPPPKSSPLAALWFVHTLHRSMVSGGAHLTPSLYIPRRLWFQSGIRIAAIDAKLSVLGQLTQSFASIGTHLALPDVDALLAPPAPAHDERSSDAAPWEASEARDRADQEKDDLHRSCVALHYWLNSLEETLESSRRLLGKKLKFVAAPANGNSHAHPPPPPPPPPPHLGTSTENLQGSIANMSIAPVSMYSSGPHADGAAANGSLQNLLLSHADLVASAAGGVPASPLSPGGPGGVDPIEARLSEARAPEPPGSAVPSAMGASRDALNKDQIGNSRFKGLGKLGKSVDRIYSNMQKEKLDDTSAYVAALQHLFEAAMVLEDIMHYFSRIASDDELAGWFADAPQSPASLMARRPPERSHAAAEPPPAPAPTGPASPQLPHAALVSEPSMSSMNSGSERKSSSASIPAANAAAAAEKKIRRRSNYFGQRQLAAGLAEGIDPRAAATKPRGDSFSIIPRLVPAVPAPPAAAAGTAPPSTARWVLAQSPIKNPASYVRQGRGRAPGVIYARLVKITEWLSHVLVAWVVRDLQALYAKYIKRLREWASE